MRNLLSLCVAAAVVAALAAPAGAIIIPGDTGYAVFKSNTWDSGTIYAGPDGVYDPANLPGNVIAIPGPGNKPGEDTWGIVRVEQSFVGDFAGPPPASQDVSTVGSAVWNSGDDGRELVGIFWGASDKVITINGSGTPNATQSAVGSGLKFMLWDQAVGTFTNPGSGNGIGSADRGANPWEFLGLGTNYDPTAKVALTGYAVGGYLDPTDPTIDFSTLFFPNPSTFGSANTFMEVGDLGLDLNGDGNIDDDDVGFLNEKVDMNIFTPFHAGYPKADLHLTMATLANNPLNIPGYDGGYDWTATDFDHIDMGVVPEPITMLGLVFGVGSLAGYIRKRRMA